MADDFSAMLTERHAGHLPDHLGLEWLEARAGYVRGRFTVAPHHMAPNGFLHAGAVVALADSDVVKVQNLDMAQSLPVSGPLKAVTSAFIKARVAGELQDLSVREGDFVKAGQVIARIDATEFKARVRQAQQQALRLAQTAAHHRP